MIRLPVFGKDSVPHASSRVLGLGATTFIWLIFLICAIYIGPGKENKVKYEVVQLMLSPEDHYIPNVTQEMIDMVGGKTGGEAEVVEESAPVVEQAPVETNPVQQPVQTQKPAAQPKQNNKQPAAAASKPAPVPDTSTVPQASTGSTTRTYDYSSSVDDMIKNQTSNTKPKDYSNVDWDAMFADSATTTSSSSSSSNKVNTANSVSGSAASASSNSNQNSSSTVSNNSTNSSSQTASSSTLSSLNQMANTTATSSNSNGSSTSTNTSSSTSANATATSGAFEFEEGNVRNLRSEMKITFSSEAAKMIDENRDVIISFYIGPAGNTYNVKFERSAGIPQPVLNEIEAQIKKWIFDSADNISIAKFTLKIRKQ